MTRIKRKFERDFDAFEKKLSREENPLTPEEELRKKIEFMIKHVEKG